MSEALGVSIRLFLADGTPDGLQIIEKSNWSGIGFVFARSQIQAVSAREQLLGSGVYVLEGNFDGDGFDKQIYVGESDSALTRLKYHHGSDAKDFWSRTIVFASKDANLNKAHVRFLESRLVELANEAKRSVVSNGTAPPPPPLSEADRAEAEGFLREMLVILPVLGVDAFERAQDIVASTSGVAQPELYLEGKDASGRGQERPGGFVVFAGSRARLDEVPSMQSWGHGLRAALVEARVMVLDGDTYRFADDYVFDSPSAAAMALLGRSANGRVEWRAKDGATLKQLQMREAEQE